VRSRVEAPIVLFSYFNPILARGIGRFAEQAAASGVDGVLCVDLPPEEGALELVPALLRQGIDTIFLLAPTSDRRRVERVAETSSGFVYYVSTTGVTGERRRLPTHLLAEVRRLRRRLPQPVAVGFGISTPEQVATVAKVADGVVVGSALVRLVEERRGQGDLAAAVEAKVLELAAPLHEGPGLARRLFGRRR
jgi:tryptophan synthase alpha chain